MYDDKITCSARDILTVDGKKWKVEKVDDYTVRYNFPAPYQFFLNLHILGSS
jgi:peptide/nickel transport system substrate-binding protein